MPVTLSTQHSVSLSFLRFSHNLYATLLALSPLTCTLKCTLLTDWGKTEEYINNFVSVGEILWFYFLPHNSLSLSLAFVSLILIFSLSSLLLPSLDLIQDYPKWLAYHTFSCNISSGAPLSPFPPPAFKICMTAIAPTRSLSGQSSSKWGLNYVGWKPA